MSADSLYDNIRGYLRLNVRVVSKVGNDINVGENFTLRFTGSNSAYAANIVNQPRIVFNNTRIYVEGTRYARPADGNAWHDLPDASLYPGDASFVDIVFEARENIGGISDWFNTERVAKAWIFGDLNQDQFFTIRNYHNIHQEIDQT